MTRDFDSSSNPDAQRTATYRQWPAVVGFITSNFAVGPGKLIAKLEEHGMTALGENGDVTPDVSREVYQAAV